MKIEYTPVRELRFYPNNARTHSKKQIRQIANSIAKFGFCNPVLVDDAKQIIAGHGRVEAAKLLDIDAVPTCRLSHLSDADKRAYILADNKLAEKAGWDKELLAIELQGLIEQHNSLPNGAGNFSGPSREFGLYPGLHPEGVNREMLVPTLAAQCGCSGIFFGGAPVPPENHIRA
jgi:hypothetical protein